MCFFLIAVSYNVLVNVNIQSHSAYIAENTTTFISVNLYIDNKQEKKVMIKLLSEVAEVTGGHTFRTKAEAASGHVRLLQIKDIQEGILTDFSALPFADIQPEKLKINLQTNDILLPLRGERIPAMMIVNQQSTLVTTTNQIAVIRVNSLLINPEYLYYFF